MGMYDSKKNMGWGKTMKFSAKNALREMYGHGHFSTVSSHLERWNQFVKFLNKIHIKDVSQCEITHLESYATDLKNRVESGNLKVAYAQNLLSTVNTVFDAMGVNENIRTSPSIWVGKRSTIRDIEPIVDTQVINKAKQELSKKNLNRIVCLVDLIRAYGLRSKEASLLDVKHALKEAKKSHEITIIKGTKGGRKRILKVRNKLQLLALESAVKIQANDSNLIPDNLSWIQWKNGLLRDGREYLKNNAIPGYHDQRAAYACLRYEEITGHPAPVTGHPIENKDLDLKARQILADELGHNRIDVITEYVGGRR